MRIAFHGRTSEAQNSVSCLRHSVTADVRRYLLTALEDPKCCGTTYCLKPEICASIDLNMATEPPSLGGFFIDRFKYDPW